jgi:hypothetical protein
MVRLEKQARREGANRSIRDQEMRFTVHDSPDYYQLKVSVFNDDKKTELIGETWVPLDQIVVPGGGQNDLWHHLNCKGRFAGEIRIELTYYDTRPKEEKVEEKNQVTPVQNSHEHTKEGIGGPRQPKSVKRRPLPADPTQPATPQPAISEHSQPSPMASAGPPSNHQTPKSHVQYESPYIEHQRDPSPLPNLGYQNHSRENLVSPVVYNRGGQELYQESQGKASPRGFEAMNPYKDSDQAKDAGKINYTLDNSVSRYHGPPHGNAINENFPVGKESYRADDSPTHDPHLEPYHHSDLQSYSAGGNQNHHDTYGMKPARALPSMPQQHSMPEAYPNSSVQPASQQNHMQSLSSIQTYETPIRHHFIRANDDQWPNSPPDADGPPPPPPIHRTSGLGPSQERSERDHTEAYPPIVAPAPLNVRNHRGSASGSPVAHFQNAPSYNAYPPSNSPSNLQLVSRSAASVSYAFNTHSSREQPQPNLGTDVQMIPPSLVPGYEPGVVEEGSQRLLDEKRVTTRRTHTTEPAVYQAYPGPQPTDEPLPQYESLSIRSPHQESQTKYQSHPVQGSHSEYSQPPQSIQSRSSQPQSYPGPQNDQLKRVRPQEMARERIVHSSSAPAIESGPVKPDPRTPMRKSVSPAPERPPGERSTSAVPFSPDSYETFNPSLSAASSINFSGPQYKTPEQARDAQYEREKEARLSEGPIIDSDGQVIDPSDHLPTDTWAPEPEPKPSRKGPEITLRFRHAPHGAQPMPLSARRSPHDRSARPHSNSTPNYAPSPDSTSPGSLASRAHLQKRVQGSPLQPTSTSVVPTVHTYVGRSANPRASVSDYPLPSIETYGYGYVSSTFSSGAHRAGNAPPVPGKIPIPRADEDTSMDALSQEMRRIDIGVGGGSARSRRSRFGP